MHPKYGIRVVGDTDLTIKLSGTNSITLDNGGGIFADGSSDNYNIIGDGKLTIDVKWDALYTLNGNISISEGAELDITSVKGCGITSYNKGKLSIDGPRFRRLILIKNILQASSNGIFAPNAFAILLRVKVVKISNMY